MCVRSSTTSYGSFNLDMDRSPGFGSMISDSNVLLTLAFASAPDLKSLTLPLIITRRTVLQKVRRRTFVLRQLVNTGFQVLFHSPPGVLFTFPSQYLSLIHISAPPKNTILSLSCTNCTNLSILSINYHTQNITFIVLKFINIIPVSYTHLDVYKRQL